MESLNSDHHIDQVKLEKVSDTNISLLSARTISNTNYPPNTDTVEGMVSLGYCVLSGTFKSGKSNFSLEMGLAVAEGKEFLGKKTNAGSVLILALEECEEFTKERLQMVSDGDIPNNLYFLFRAKTLDDGLLDMLDEIHAQIDDLRLVIVDTLAYVECQPKRGESAYKKDYRTGAMLKQWADEHRLSVIAVTHTTKLVHPEDVFSNTSGTNGVTAPADSIITIAKERRTDQVATLAIIGRRVRESYHEIQMDDNCVWKRIGDASIESIEERRIREEKRMFEESDIRKTILKIMESGLFEGRAQDIKERANEYGISLLCSTKEIGLFLHNYQKYFLEYEGIKVCILKNGTGSKSYRIEISE